MLKKFGRKVAFSGRSMINYMKVANELGSYIDIPENIIIDIDQIPQYTPQEIVVTTGSQGEPMSALTRMAFSDHRRLLLVQVTLLLFQLTQFPVMQKVSG